MMLDKIFYGAHGLFGRLGQRPKCPNCETQSADNIDRKYFHKLFRCPDCELLFRYPREDEYAMHRFYQFNYHQSGLTTDLPDDVTLRQLVRSNFAGTSKDFQRFVDLFAKLKIPKNSRILDFGANWGYAMHQFKVAGFDVAGYEISTTRAAFGRKIDLNVLVEWAEVSAEAPFDVAFSAHVLEHTHNPAEAIQRQIQVLKPGGVLIAVFPHGSPCFRESDPRGFHSLWGRVHPVLPTVSFLKKVLPKPSWFIGAMTHDNIEKISAWDGLTPTLGDTTQSELLVVYRT